MRNKKIEKIKRPFAILLAFSFLISILAMSANASENNNDSKNGYDKGYIDGKKQGQNVCKKYGARETLIKIPSPSNKYNLVKYSTDYKNGYERGFTNGYNAYRYNCLKNKK